MFGNCCWMGGKSGFQCEIPSLDVISEESKCCNALCALWNKQIPINHAGDVGAAFPVVSITGMFGIFPYILPHVYGWLVSEQAGKGRGCLCPWKC